jgi:hypothetical protein
MTSALRDHAETDGDIKVTLSSAPGADVTTLDLATVTVGTVDVARAKVMASLDTAAGGRIVLRFARQALLDAACSRARPASWWWPVTWPAASRSSRTCR